LDGPLPKWCSAVALSRQDGRHSAVAWLLKAALIQVSDYRLLGASGYGRLSFPGISISFPRKKVFITGNFYISFPGFFSCKI
jgi:hypothetical protein